MTGLLIRAELFPGLRDAAPVPPAHVFKQMFLHEETSDLALYRQRKRLGALHVQPHRTAETPGIGATHTLNLTGNSTLDILGQPDQRMSLKATFELDDTQSIRHFDFFATIRAPHTKGAAKEDDSLGISFDGSPVSDRYHYLIRHGEVLDKEASGTMEQLLSDPGLQVFGIDPRTVVKQAFAQAAGSFNTDARRSSMQFNGETVDTYLLTFHHGDTLESTVQMTQLGQILLVSTFAGYDLYDETLTP